MATRVRLTTLPDGELGVVKTPLSGDRRDRNAEAHWLGRAAAAIADPTASTDGEGHPRAGVVPLVGIEPTPGMPSSSPTIITERVAGETLRTTWLAPAGVATALALVANLLADLHTHGLVHGNLSADHIILDPEGPRLCSPHGAVTDPLADSRALGRCLRSMLDRWDRLDTPVPLRDEWEHLASSLDPSPDSGEHVAPLPLRRAARTFDRLAATVSASSQRANTPVARRRPWGLVVAGSAGVLSLAGLAVVDLDPGDASTTAGTEVEIGGHRYQIDAPSGSVTVLRHACDHQPDVVVLDADRDLIWRFDPADTPTVSPGDTSTASVMVEVPGVQRLVVEDGERCPVVWAVGPAGRTLVIDER